MEPSQTPKSLSVIAIQAPSGVYFVPGKANSFASLKYEFVYLDSGCSTHLLPFPTNISATEFSTIFQDYPWSIAYTGAAGALNTPVLFIHCGAKEEFQIKLDWSNCAFPSKFLRFHLSIEDCENLVKTCASRIDSKNIEKLNSFIKIVNKIKEIEKNLKIGGRRKAALVGQTVLDNLLVFQCKPVMFGFVKGTAFTEMEQLIKTYPKFVDPETIMQNEPQFRDLHEEDHDGEDFIDLNKFSYNYID